MPSIIKNIHLLKDIDPSNIDHMEVAALNSHRRENVTFKVIANTKGQVIIQAIQGKTRNKVYLNRNGLVEMTEKTFDPFFPEKKIVVKPILFAQSPAEIVDPKWIEKKMSKAGLRLKDIVADTGIDNTQLSALINGIKPLSQPMKALFWFYFLSKENLR